MKQSLVYILPFFILGVFFFCIYYLSNRFSWSFNLPFRATLIGFSVLSVGVMAGVMTIMRQNWTSVASHVLNNVGYIFLGTMMLMVCTMLALDLVRLVLKISPLTFGVASVGIVTLLTLYAVFNASRLKVIERTIDLPNVVAPVRIAHLSDVHIGHFWGEKTVARLVKKVKDAQVDVVVITGDLFDGQVRMNDEVLKPFEQLDVPIYFAEGNHDGYSGSRRIKQLLEKHGIQVLDNKKVEVKGLQIIGLDYSLPDHSSPDPFHPALTGQTMQEVLPQMQVDPQRASVLLHHNPIGVNYAAQNGINLYLAGHTHAGQLFPATIVAGWMFEYNKGLYTYNGQMQVFVSQGTGTYGPPMRLGTDSEIAILNIQ